VREVCYERLLPHQIVAARTACPLAYLPIGTVEWHGEHNATGLDTLKAHALCVRAATASGGLVFPPLWYGEHREIQLMEANPASRSAIADKMQLPPENFEAGYMGGRTVEAQAYAYCQLLAHILDQIKSLGFRAVFVLCGHYPLAQYAAFSGAVFERRTGIPVYACKENDLVADLGYRGDHAGKWETSLLMHLEPGLTDLTRLPEDRSVKPVGVGGEDPRDATTEFGRDAADAVVERMARRAAQLLEKA
jgi:creatinine amidohydrolase